MNPFLLLAVLAVVAFLYASVGHGGASGYLAIMALLGYSQDVMRPSALVMNLFVSAVSFAQFARAGHFRWKLFWPFAVASVPLAYVGAQVTLDPLLYKRVLAVCLLFAVGRLFGLFGGGSGERNTLQLVPALLVGALLGYSQDVMRPSALVMNLFVSAVSFTQFARAGHFRWKLFWPFAVASVPLAYVGAQVTLDPLLYKRVLAVCLLFAVGRLFGLFGGGSGERNTLRLVPALLVGAVLGFVSGVIGIGGGILLSPVLLVFRWADAKETAAVSALFIFVNSASGIVGALGSGQTLNPDVVGWVAAALVGGLLGGYVGSRRLTEPRLRQVLGVVLLLASVKLMLP